VRRCIQQKLVLKQQKHKRFSYKPRFQDGHKTSEKESFEDKWLRERHGSRHKTFKMSRLTLLLILLAVVLILMYVLSNISDEYALF
jgi:hypothetical protein